MIRRMAVLCLLLVVLGAAGAQADENGKGEPPPRVATHHSMTLGNRHIDYEAIAETLPLRDAKGEITATIFAVSYIADSEASGGRPVSFVFNGGPGAASVFLHLGALGPMILRSTLSARATADFERPRCCKACRTMSASA